MTLRAVLLVALGALACPLRAQSQTIGVYPPPAGGGGGGLDSTAGDARWIRRFGNVAPGNPATGGTLFNYIQQRGDPFVYPFYVADSTETNYAYIDDAGTMGLIGSTGSWTWDGSDNATGGATIAANNPAGDQFFRYEFGMLELPRDKQLVWSDSTNINDERWRTGIGADTNGVIKATKGMSTSGQDNQGIGTFRIGDPYTRPTCTATKRGTFWADTTGAGVADSLFFCSKASGGTYSWKLLVAG